MRGRRTPGTWCIVPTAAAFDRSLGQVTPFHVLAAVTRYRDNSTGEGYPSVERLAADLAISTRMVRTHLRRLIEAGYLEVDARFLSNGKQTSNCYVVHFEGFADRRNAALQSASQPDLGEAAGTDAIASSDALMQSVPRVKSCFTLEEWIATGVGEAGGTDATASSDAQIQSPPRVKPCFTLDDWIAAGVEKPVGVGRTTSGGGEAKLQGEGEAKLHPYQNTLNRLPENHAVAAEGTGAVGEQHEARQDGAGSTARRKTAA